MGTEELVRLRRVAQASHLLWSLKRARLMGGKRSPHHLGVYWETQGLEMRRL